MTAILACVRPGGDAAWAWLRRQLVLLAWHLLDGRPVLHAAIAAHLTWEAAKLLGPGDEFMVDPRAYAGMIAVGGEAFWLPFLFGGAVAGLLGLLASRWVVRTLSALAMGTVELVFVHYLTLPGLSPTAGPTYHVLTWCCCWLAFAHPLGDRFGRRR